MTRCRIVVTDGYHSVHGQMGLLILSSLPPSGGRTLESRLWHHHVCRIEIYWRSWTSRYLLPRFYLACNLNMRLCLFREAPCLELKNLFQCSIDKQMVQSDSYLYHFNLKIFSWGITTNNLRWEQPESSCWSQSCWSQPAVSRRRSQAATRTPRQVQEAWRFQLFLNARSSRNVRLPSIATAVGVSLRVLMAGHVAIRFTASVRYAMKVSASWN
jgi:hypothetical protein